MRKTKEVLKQKWSLGLSHREIARSQSVGEGTVSDVLYRARVAGLVEWAQVEPLDEAELERRLYTYTATWQPTRPVPNWAEVQAERHKAGVTLELLHHEYKLKHPDDGYEYSQFCEHLRRWLRDRGLTMRQPHRAGDKGFVDYSGKRPCLVDPKTGEPIPVELFVMVLGASNLTFAEASLTQTLADWIASHVRALSYFGGVPAALVPDQLRSAVAAPCRYEPGINRTYEDLAEHYDAVVLPARPAKPRDKAKAEVGVQIAQRWVLARLRHQTFFSLDSMNERIAELREELNDRPMRVYKASRRELFEKLERPALKPLPATPYVLAEFVRCTVNIDYHVEVDGHYYSVDHGLRGEEVWARVTAMTIEILHNGVRHTSHLRSRERGRHTTKPEHMPHAHREHLEWSPSRLIEWARKEAGSSAGALVEAILNERKHPEQGYRSCLGIIRLAKKYGADRLEAACARALVVRARSYRHVESILKNGLDRLPTPPATEPPATDTSHRSGHENIRGPGYYH